MPKRSYSAAGTYRYGFNGKENDNEVKGLGNQQDYGMRIYDARVGRFLSVDKLQTSFPDLTPYQFSGNTPIQAIDLDGLEPKGFMDYWQARTDPYMTKWGYTVQDFYDYETKQVWTVMNYPNTSQYYYWQTTYEKGENLFKPLNSTLNKDASNDWTGKFKEFKPKRLSEDKSFDMLMVGILTVPFVVVYGKAMLVYLASEVLEELAGIPIPDGPVDLWKYEMKQQAKREIAERAMKNTVRPESDGMEFLDNNSLNTLDRIPLVPQKAKDYAKYLKENNGTPMSGYRGGREFLNDGRQNGSILPKTDAKGNAIKYREYDIHPRVAGKDRGSERLVLGSDGSTYFTDDHYLNFTRIDK